MKICWLKKFYPWASKALRVQHLKVNPWLIENTVHLQRSPTIFVVLIASGLLFFLIYERFTLKAFAKKSYYCNHLFKSVMSSVDTALESGPVLLAKKKRLTKNNNEIQVKKKIGNYMNLR